VTRVRRGALLLAGALALAGCTTPSGPPPGATAGAVTDAQLARIGHVIVIYGENRSFDNLYGGFPGADGLANAPPEQTLQRDLDGTPLPVLPPVWKGNSSEFDPAFGRTLANGPFRIDAAPARLPLSVPTRDLVHRYYQNIAQINGGTNDRFAALSDAGGLVMGTYDGSGMRLWQLAREFTLADHFFMGAFGGSYLNHMWLACACTPRWPEAPAALRATLGPDGMLALRPTGPASSLAGPVQWEHDGALTPDGFTVNTMQPSYQPSGIAPAPGGDPRLADPAKNPLPPQAAPTIGDRLSDKGISWAWYAGQWDQAVSDGARPAGGPRGVIYSNQPGTLNFQPHHQPYNYFARYAPGTPARAEHLRDATELFAAIDQGRLPQVAFYKPVGDLNQHPGYTDIASGDAHIADLVERIRRSPAWDRTLVIVTYDENGGFWDHVAPPAGPGWSDRWGPGTRIPTILVGPFVRKGTVDHTAYDTTSILRLLTRRFRLEPLPGVRANTGDLTGALDFGTAR
jgi:acid phosphatase